MTSIERTTTLPAYAELLDAYQTAFQKELQLMLEHLPICSGDAVLDVGCGDGDYSLWMAPLVAPEGHVTGIDINQVYLQQAKDKAQKSPFKKLMTFQEGKIEKLPFKDETFDFIWCAQSLFSFPEPLEALKEMARVTRRRGIIAIMEDDTLHQVLLPWPIEAELDIRQAEWEAFKVEHPDAERFYVARDLRRLFAEARLQPQRRKTYVLHRVFPVGTEERRFLNAYLTNLRDRTRPFLTAPKAKRWIPLLSPSVPSYLPDQPHFSMTCLDHVFWAKKP
jgi:ubiquinone/menaquinone biosynthesis C-methylase UbiE